MLCAKLRCRLFFLKLFLPKIKSNQVLSAESSVVAKSGKHKKTPPSSASFCPPESNRIQLSESPVRNLSYSVKWQRGAFSMTAMPASGRSGCP